jgi:hypothetical protein
VQILSPETGNTLMVTLKENLEMVDFGLDEKAIVKEATLIQIHSDELGTHLFPVSRASLFF